MSHDKIIGIGYAGINILHKIARENLKTIDLVAMDSANDMLLQSNAHEKIFLSEHGLGAGGDAKRGAEYAESSQDAIYEALADTNRLIMTYGLGGGTGAGSAPVVARIAHVIGIEDIRAFVIFPFSFEGFQRQQQAKHNLSQIKAKVQRVRILKGDNVSRFVGQTTSTHEAYDMIMRVAMWQILSQLIA